MIYLGWKKVQKEEENDNKKDKKPTHKKRVS